jgi:hypothetical protein
MTKKTYKKIKPFTSKVEEPGSGYNTITISTLQGQEEANYIYWLSLTPEKRFELHYNLISHFFADELKKKRNSNRIIFSE